MYGMTVKQLAVLALLAAGKPNKEIAAQLRLECKKIKNFMRHVYRNTATTSRLELALLVQRNGRLKAQADAALLSYLS